MIFYKIYTSIPTVTPTRDIIDKITEESIVWNSAHGITGILLCLEDRYFQFLEGEEEQVLNIFNKIKTDPRHKELYVRIKGFEKERIFREWSMGSWMLNNEELNSLSALGDLNAYMKDSGSTVYSPKKFVSMMQNILDTWIAHEPERSKRLRG